MTDREIQTIAERVAQMVANEVVRSIRGLCGPCVFSEDEIAAIRQTVRNAQEVRRTALTAAVGALVLAALSALGYGVIELIKRNFGGGR